MSWPELLIGAAVGGAMPGGGLLIWFLSTRQRRAAVKNTDSQTEFTVAQASEVLAKSATEWINSLNIRVESLNKTVERLEGETDVLTVKLRESTYQAGLLKESLRITLDLLAEHNIARPRLPID